MAIDKSIGFEVCTGKEADLIAIHNFSKKYYQLLVTCDPDVFKTNNVTFPLDRALSQRYVPEEILTRCSSLSEEGIAELKTFPAIVCMENTGFNGITDPNQTAIFAYITRVKMEGYQVRVAFQPIAPFHQKILCEKKYAIYFDLNMSCAITDLNLSAWSVHKVNLFEAFNEAGLMDAHDWFRLYREWEAGQSERFNYTE